MDIDNFISLLMGVGFIVWLICALVGIVIYVFNSVVLMNYINDQQGESSWMAWLPIVDMYAVTNATYRGETSVQCDIFNKAFPIWIFQWQTVLIWAASIVLGWIPIIGAIAWLIIIAARVVIFGQVYKDAMAKYGVEINVVERILVTLIPLVASIRLFAAMKNGSLV